MHKLTGILDKAVSLTLNNRPSKIIKSPYVADAVTKSGKKVLVHTPFLNLGEQCKSKSKIYATLSNESSKTDFIAQLVEFDDKMYGKVKSTFANATLLVNVTKILAAIAI